MHTRARLGLPIFGLAMIAATAVCLLPIAAGAQTSAPDTPQSQAAPPPPDAPPPPPDYVPPPPPPDDAEPPPSAAGATGPGATGTPAPPPPDGGIADQAPPDYGQAPAEVAAPPAPLGGPPLEAGEAYHTRFSGTVQEPGPAGPATVIDLNGVVGSIVDLRNLAEPALGQHLIGEPQRAPATAADVGQVFGIAIDDSVGPNIFVTATSAFGLHLSPGTTEWMAGMWGPEGGPGTIYRLSPETGYVPEFFAEVTLDGRRNTGAALGNIAYDRWNRQLYVSDLETGMIHRLSVDDGTDLGRYDHGIEGRPGFVDAASGQALSLAPVGFDPATAARLGNCSAGPFERHPECWNHADFRRRVWGLAVRRDDARDEVRLHYAVWGSEALGNPAWADAGDDRRNSVWSVRIGKDGGFDTASVRREFVLPDFFTTGAMAGNSRPISDIEFSHCAPQGAMLLSERGGTRNLGLDAADPFASPHESRVLRYEIGADAVWRPAGRYDVGFYERQEHGLPRLRASGGGGCDFGFGYGDDGTIDPARPNEFVWMTGDNLCSPRGACLDPGSGAFDDTSWVDGLQGTPADLAQEILPDAALAPPPSGPATPPDGPSSSYMIDSDINLDPTGNLLDTGVDRNEATFSGDVDVFERCAAVDYGILAPPDFAVPVLPPPVHLRDMTHMRNASPMHNVNRSWHERSWSWHDRDQSWHYRNRSWHSRDRSWHWRAGSWHSRDRSWHSRERSWHWRDRSWHWRNGSWHNVGRSWHSRDLTWHWKAQSWHAKPRSWHWRNSSWHDKRQSWHSRDRSWHGKDRSWHSRDRSWHDRDRSSHGRADSLHRVHDTHRSREQQHARQRSLDQQHARQRSLDQHHARQRSLDQQHSRERSQHRDGASVHSRTRSQQRPDDGAKHSRERSQHRDGANVHSRTRSQQSDGATHARSQSKKRDGGATHAKAQSQKRDGATAHSRARSQPGDGATHARSQSQKHDGGAKHAKAQSQKRDGGSAHSRSLSKQKQDGGGKHARAQSQHRDGANVHKRSQSRQRQDGGAKQPHAQSQKQQRHGVPVHNRSRSRQEER